jgi:hypothetical protein
VYFSCLTRSDENETLSICPGGPRIYTWHRSFHLCYRGISVHPPSLLNDILGGCDLASEVMHFDAEIE